MDFKVGFRLNLVRLVCLSRRRVKLWFDKKTKNKNYIYSVFHEMFGSFWVSRYIPDYCIKGKSRPRTSRRTPSRVTRRVGGRHKKWPFKSYFSFSSHRLLTHPILPSRQGGSTRFNFTSDNERLSSKREEKKKKIVVDSKTELTGVVTQWLVGDPHLKTVVIANWDSEGWGVGGRGTGETLPKKNHYLLFLKL